MDNPGFHLISSGFLKYLHLTNRIDSNRYFDTVIGFDYFTSNQKMPDREQALIRHQNP
jgi:hypothetical protein